MTDSRLKAPLGQHLTEHADRAALARVRRRLFEARVRPLPAHVWRWAAGVALVVVLLGGAWSWARRLQPGELLTHAGRPFVRLDGGERGARLELADGSWLSAQRGAVVHAVASSGREFSVLLEQGTLEVRVVPNGPRKWCVESKWARIEVVGTRFVLERTERGLGVRVTEGVVVVRSTRLAEGVQRVNAGESLFVGEDGADVRGPTALPAAPSSPPPSSPAPATQSNPTSTPADSPSGPKATSSSAAPPASAAQLLDQADSARAQGNVADASRMLRRLIDEFPTSEQVPWARYRLGVALAERGEVSEARVLFAALVAARPPNSLWQDALLRQLELEIRLGDEERARDIAAEYRARFPSGRHLERIASLTAPRTSAPPPASQP
ncbi:MAG TPA: tetratricopeptide repeat protein [Polyangiaceae bacterium]|nr:tetratricopeptide repeat protein [Polyangiaceae bacterium]